MDASSQTETKDETFIFRLFVAGDEPNSTIALTNLRKICESHIKGPYNIEIVDVFKFADIALELGIFVSPALVRILPKPKIIVFGTLRDIAKVGAALQLR